MHKYIKNLLGVPSNQSNAPNIFVLFKQSLDNTNMDSGHIGLCRIPVKVKTAPVAKRTGFPLKMAHRAPVEWMQRCTDTKTKNL